MASKAMQQIAQELHQIGACLESTDRKLIDEPGRSILLVYIVYPDMRNQSRESRLYFYTQGEIRYWIAQNQARKLSVFHISMLATWQDHNFFSDLAGYTHHIQFLYRHAGYDSFIAYVEKDNAILFQNVCNALGIEHTGFDSQKDIDSTLAYTAKHTINNIALVDLISGLQHACVQVRDSERHLITVRYCDWNHHAVETVDYTEEYRYFGQVLALLAELHVTIL